MIPSRFRIIRPYLASYLHPRFGRPHVSEVMNWLTQPSKKKRASQYIRGQKEDGEFIEVTFANIAEPFFYPRNASWIDFCQTVDEVFNAQNWHHFVSENTPLDSGDTVVDCGAAEGLFSFFAAQRAKKVYAIEPIPMWHQSMSKTFGELSKVEVLKVGVGHTKTVLRMTNDEIYSRISSNGELEIPISTLDEMFANNNIPVTFLKADIEGFEFQMLLGAEELIRGNRPKISITMYHNANHFEQVKEFLLNIHSDYQFKLRGLAENGNPVLLQAF